MRILMIDNNFHGAYGSFNVFLDEIERSLVKNMHTVRRARNISEAISIYESVRPDFSIGIGKYLMYVENEALCDLYNVAHYQWIVDNPCKTAPSKKLERFVPIFIDREFPLMWPWKLEKYLCLPVGFERPASENLSQRKRGILFSGQIKNLELLREEINSSSQKKLLLKFLNVTLANLQDSFIMQYQRFLKENTVGDETELFRLANSYVRCLKRIKVLQSIREYPLILAGNIQNNDLVKRPNVVCLGEIPYIETLTLFSEYEFVLNVSPNFSFCIHDRILRALSAGSKVITDRNPTIVEFFGERLNYFDYGRLVESDMLRKRDFEKYEIDKILAQFEWQNLLNVIIKDCTGRKTA